MYKEKNEKITLAFEIERVRPSVTQGGANLYCNGELIGNFGDNIEMITEETRKTYGPEIGGYASTTAPEKFISALFFNPYRGADKYRDKLRAIMESSRKEP